MKEERTVWVEGDPYVVVLSDEKEALLAAQAAGRAVVGIEPGCGGTRDLCDGRMGGGEDSSGASGNPDTEFLPCRYLVDAADTADGAYLERVVRRHMGFPWKIAETERLLIREFTAADAEDVPREDGDREDDRVFYTPQLLARYIQYQYGFYEFGIWALLDKASGRLVGKAGVTAAGSEVPDVVSMGGEVLNAALGESAAADGVPMDSEAADVVPKECAAVNAASEASAAVGVIPMDGEASDAASGESAAANAVPAESAAPAAGRETGGAVCLELGYHIFQPFRGHGYAKEACRGILQTLAAAWRREEGQCEPAGSRRRLIVYARTEASNTASVHVLRSCGFRPVGRRAGKKDENNGSQDLLFVKDIG